MRYALKNTQNELIRHQEFDGLPPQLAPEKGLSWHADPVPLPEPPTLESVRDAKIAEINAARLAANQSFFMHQGKQVACDTLSRGDIDAVNGIVALTGGLPPGWIGGWKAIDNSIIVISSQPEWVMFYAAMVQQGTTHFTKAQGLKAQLEAAYLAGDRAAMEAIAW